MAPDHPLWIRVLLRIASRRATDAELGDVIEEHVAAGRSAFWFVRQLVSIVRRRRSHLTMAERGAAMLSNICTDVRYALRTLRRNRGFAVAAIVPIALGIGINTGVFAILNSVAWRALPVPNPDELVSIYQDFRGGPRRTVHGARALFSLPEYHAYRDESHMLSGLMAYSRHWTLTLGRESPQEIEGIVVTCNYFDVLRLSPAIGMGFTTANCRAPGAPAVVVLSHALWKGAFGGDAQIVGKAIVLNGHNFIVVGVAPVGFDGIDMAKAAFFVPTSMADVLRPEQRLLENANLSWLTLIGRRRNDANVAQVRAELSLVANRIDQQESGRTTSLIVEPATALSLPVARRAVLRGAGVVLAAFGLVLLIAAGNVANILLARAAGRSQEVAIRLSVGAKRGRLIQQLLTESAIIALAGAVCGSLLFWWSFDTLIPWVLASTGAQAMRIDATPDRTVLWFALALTAITALGFGLVPALRASTADIQAVMKQDAAGSSGGRGWIRGTLIGAQIALCTMLLIPAGLMSRALYAAYTFDPGFDYRNVAVASIDLRGPRYANNERVAIFHEEWLEQVSRLPGVERIAQANRIPLSPGRSQATFRVDDDVETHVFDLNAVSPEFFALLDIPIVRGRVFSSDETNAVLVTESTARRYWPGQDAIGRALVMENGRRYIVGIVADAQIAEARDASSSYVYLPIARGAQRRISVLARTSLPVHEFAAAVRAEASRMDASLVVNVQPLSDNLVMLQTLQQIGASIAATVSLLALALAAIGIYGVVAYVVSRRRREVGVRMALGACARDVQRLIMRETLRPVAVGMAIGVGVAAGIAQVLRSVLFGVSPYDPVAFIGAPLIMLIIAAAAAFMPTRRAMRVNPMSVLRSE